MVRQTEAIKNFLTHKTVPDLAALYNEGMEVQVKVAQDGGEKIEGDYKGKTWAGYTDHVQTWKPFRIPWNANTDPTYDYDKSMNFDLSAHAEAIGMTGWDFKNKVSKWIAFDFDAIVGHSIHHDKKLTDVQLQEIQDVVKSIPWVTIRRSTGGRGLHLYVHVNDVPTINHTEHAALARCILGTMSGLVGYDFAAKVDTCGSNIWVWHRKMIGTNGLQLVRQGTVYDGVQENWRDHIPVVSGRRKRTCPSFIASSMSEDVEKVFEELSGQRTKIVVDDGHKQLIKYLADNGYYWDWDADHSMLVTHTAGLRDAHEALHMKGVFKTLAEGKEKGDKNCFMFPMKNSEWVVKRFSPGCAEDPTWFQDGAGGYTSCYLNRTPDLRIAACSQGGVEDSKGRFIFSSGEEATIAGQLLGLNLALPVYAQGRKVSFKQGKENRLISSLIAETDDKPTDFNGWVRVKDTWEKVFYYKMPNNLEYELGNYDEMVRHLISITGEDLGWCLKTEKGWTDEPLVHVRIFLGTLGLNTTDVAQVLGSCVANPWTCVSIPFEAEYPSNRIWNRRSAQLAFIPTENKDNLQYTHWLKLLNHLGVSLNEAVQAHPWCKQHGIDSGADYLKCWIASMFQNPHEPLPYLFFYGPQNSGKSSFHEAIELLVTQGVMRADQAIVNKSGFNGELEFAFLCAIEEIDLNKNRDANARVKDYVTATKILLHVKGQTARTVANTTHWCQCGNELKNVPIFTGDTRITVLYVPPLDPTELIPKRDLLDLLKNEAPDFLAEIMSIELPPCPDRLGIPILNTHDKKQAEQNSRSSLETFLDEKCYYYPGHFVPYKDLWDLFQQNMEPNEIHNWTQIRMGKELPRQYPKGRSRRDSSFIVGNISFTPPPENEPFGKPFTHGPNNTLVIE